MVKTGSFTTTPDLKPAAAIVYPIGKSVKGILYDMGTRAALLSTNVGSTLFLFLSWFFPDQLNESSWKSP